jgi:hypothetical protein
MRALTRPDTLRIVVLLEGKEASRFPHERERSPIFSAVTSVPSDELLRLDCFGRVPKNSTILKRYSDERRDGTNAVSLLSRRNSARGGVSNPFQSGARDRKEGDGTEPSRPWTKRDGSALAFVAMVTMESSSYLRRVSPCTAHDDALDAFLLRQVAFRGRWDGVRRGNALHQ